MNPLVRRQRGFSLLEMAVVLLIAGLLGAALWKLLPLLRPLESRAAVQAQLTAAEQALGGFALTQHRLPCPATQPGGLETCAQAGRWLPQATLGLSGPPLRYGVYRAPGATALADADLAVSLDRFEPRLPPDGPRALTAVNGLDLCKALHNGQLNPQSGRVDGGSPAVAVAFALAHPGGGDADNDGDAFDGLNAGVSFEPSERPQRLDYDDSTLLVGFAELAGRLGCPAAISRADGAARSAYVGYDNRRFAELYHEFRILGHHVRRQNTVMATAALGLATAELVITLGTTASAVYQAAATAGIGAVVVVKAGVAVGLAIKGVQSATSKLLGAQEAEELAQEQKAAAVLELARFVEAETLALAAAVLQHNRGLLP